MSFQPPVFAPIIAEIFILVMACVALLFDLFAKERNRILTYLLVQAALIGAAIITGAHYNEPRFITFNGMFIHDQIASLLKLFIYVTSFAAFWYSYHYLKDKDIPRGEYYVLGLFCVLGMMLLVSGHSLLTIYLGLEVVSLPLYAMVALQRNNYQATEAAMKYFIMGSIASGMLLYGMSMIYGATGHLDISKITQAINHTPEQMGLLFAFGLVFIVVGIGFKLAAAPFHMWAPDVYQGAPTSVTLFLSSAPKIAALGMLIRLLITAMPQLHLQWEHLLLIMSVISIGLGNLIAIVQVNIKRMLAYSAIAHTGYMLLGIIAGTPEGYGSALFYIISYAVMSAAGFGMLTLLSRTDAEITLISDLKGLNERNSWLAFLMLIIMFSMIGVPPTVGFFAKFGVIQALINAQHIKLAIFAMIFAVIGAFYYLRVLTIIYFRSAEDNNQIVCTSDAKLAISINAITLLLLGIFPSSLMTLCRIAFS
ncbi:MAG: NADH-quinone oxidoreductase subunit NuoN [Gammaproteobacteria bacterium]